MRKTVDKIKDFLGANPQAFLTDEAYQLASLRYAPDMADVIWEIKRAFEKGIAPEKNPHGSSLSYFLKDCDGKNIAIFKQKRLFHELAAYRLDRGHFAGVPQTVITTLEHPVFEGKLTGSCQLFIHNAVRAFEVNVPMIDLSHSHRIRKIATLDIRMMNEDRNASNLLVVNEQEMIPIDHGYIFPHDLGSLHMTWLDWVHSATKFTEAELWYIALLDPESDRRMLIDEMHLDEVRANRNYIATIFLKSAAIRGLSAREMGNMMSRGFKSPKEISRFEYLIETIKEKNPPSRQLFTRIVYEEVEKLLDNHEKISQHAHKTAHR